MGDEVLILLPTNNHSIKAKFQGAHTKDKQLQIGYTRLLKENKDVT